MNFRARRISIRARLALFYAAILGAALLVYGSGVYIVLQDQLERSFDAQLLANVEHAAGAFAQDVDGSGRIDPAFNPLVSGGSIWDLAISPDASHTVA